MNGRYYVGEWLVEPEQSRLVRGSESAKLDPKSVQVLSFLAAHPNEVLTKEQIIDSVWDGAFVSDEVLTTAIWGLRKALGDDAKEPSYIQTIPRRGYRLIAPVERAAGEVSGRWEPSPYPGLSAFSQRDARYFFGREAEVEALWAKLQGRNLLGLIGPSGAGKSSLLRAGILPACPDGWGVLLCQPRNDPFRSFEGFEAWRAEHKEALVIVDQFEELFTLNDEETQSRFAEHLGRLSQSGVHVLLSMRDDFLIRCDSQPALAPVFRDLTPVSPLSGPALRRALTEPARASGYRFEDESLVAEILTEVSRERGALPLVAFAAAKLWERRDREGRRLTREAYHSIGGVAGALAKHAEESLSKIGLEREPIVREIFRNLVSAQGMRVPSDKEELLTVFADRETAAGVLGKLIDARLLTSVEEEVEIIHESLLTAWPRLVRWQAQDAEGAVLRDQLRQAAKLWEDRGRTDDLLWSGTAFREFALWRERYPGGLTATEEAFASAAAVNTQRRRHRRQMAIGVVIACLSVGLVVVGGLWRRAATESLRAEASKLLALGQVELGVDPTAALAYAIRSLELADTEVGRLFALRVVQTGPVATMTVLPSVTEANASGVLGRPIISPNGKWLALGGWHRVQLIRSDGGAPLLLGDYRWDDKAIVKIAFGPKSDVLMANRRGDVRVWSLPEGRELRRGQFEEGDSAVYVTEDGFVTLTKVEEQEVIRWWPFTKGDSHLVGMMPVFNEADVVHGWLTYSRGNRVYLQSLEDLSSSPRLVGEHPADVRSVALGQDAQCLASSDAAGEIRVWPTATPSAGTQRVIRDRETWGLRFDPHCTRLAGVGLEGVRGVVRVWDLTGPDGSRPVVIRRAGSPEFDPSGRWLVTSRGWDAAFWPLGDGQARVLAGHEDGIIGLVFSPDGEYVLSSGGDSLRAWPLAPGKESRVLVDELSGGFSRVTVDPRSRNVVFSGMKRALGVIPLEGGSTRELAGSESYDAPTFGDGGRLLAAVSVSTPPVVRIWDLDRGAARTLPPLPALEGNIWGLGGPRFVGQDKIVVSVFGTGLLVYDLRDDTGRILEGRIGQFELSHDGLFGVGVTGYPDQVADQPGQLVRFSLNGSPVSTLTSHGSQLGAVALNPTESVVATGGVDGTVRIGPLSGEDPHVFFGHEGTIWAMAFSPDSKWVASAGQDRLIRLWPVPDLSKPPLHKRRYEDLLRDLRSRTNLRVVPDPASATGWKLDRDPFPGWERVPES